MRPPVASPEGFVIRGGGDDFANRQERIFEQLTQLAERYERNDVRTSLSEADVRALGASTETKRSRRTVDEYGSRETTLYRGRDSIFKRPEGFAPASIRSVVPDYRRHPDKWMKYSLEDVRVEEMSDGSNARAAFSFLRELRMRKSANTKTSENLIGDERRTRRANVNSSAINYRRASERNAMSDVSVGGTIKMKDDDDAAPVYRNGKIILPEYVVGRKPKRAIGNAARSVQGKAEESSSRIRLDHLNAADD